MLSLADADGSGSVSRRELAALIPTMAAQHTPKWEPLLNRTKLTRPHTCDNLLHRAKLFAPSAPSPASKSDGGAAHADSGGAGCEPTRAASQGAPQRKNRRGTV
jgi:hypothetical protein